MTLELLGVGLPRAQCELSGVSYRCKGQPIRIVLVDNTIDLGGQFLGAATIDHGRGHQSVECYRFLDALGLTGGPFLYLGD